MSKNKQQKRKERERRVAREKHEAALQRHAAVENAAAADKKSVSRTTRVMTAAALPKATYVAVKNKMGFTHRRTGG